MQPQSDGIQVPLPWGGHCDYAPHHHRRMQDMPYWHSCIGAGKLDTTGPLTVSHCKFPKKTTCLTRTNMGKPGGPICTTCNASIPECLIRDFRGNLNFLYKETRYVSSFQLFNWWLCHCKATVIHSMFLVKLWDITENVKDAKYDNMRTKYDNDLHSFHKRLKKVKCWNQTVLTYVYQIQCKNTNPLPKCKQKMP